MTDSKDKAFDEWSETYPDDAKWLKRKGYHFYDGMKPEMFRNFAEIYEKYDSEGALLFIRLRYPLMPSEHITPGQPFSAELRVRQKFFSNKLFSTRVVKPYNELLSYVPDLPCVLYTSIRAHTAPGAPNPLKERIMYFENETDAVEGQLRFG